MGLLTSSSGKRQSANTALHIASAEFKANPFPFYGRLRAEAPVFRTILPTKAALTKGVVEGVRARGGNGCDPRMPRALAARDLGVDVGNPQRRPPQVSSLVERLALRGVFDLGTVVLHSQRDGPDALHSPI